MSVVNIKFPGNLAQVDSADDLRAVPSTLMADGSLYAVQDLSSFFTYDPGEVAPDNGSTILKPDDKTSLQAGRWVKDNDGFAPGPPGPADNTFTTLTALKASSTTNKAARLVGASGITDGSFNWTLGDFTGQADDKNIIKADSASLSVGAWVRQAANSVTFKQSGAGAVTRDAQDKSREIVSAIDFGAVGDGAMDDTAAIQAAIDTGRDVYFPGTGAGRTYMFTNLTVPSTTTLWGDGAHNSILSQVDGSTGAAITLSGGTSPDITFGSFGIEGLAVQVAASCLIGIDVPAAVSANLAKLLSLRLRNKTVDTWTTRPYPTVAGSVGIKVRDAAGAPAFKWLLDSATRIIGFETGIDALSAHGGINEWEVYHWPLDCKWACVLTAVSSWKCGQTVESGVLNARAYKLSGCSNMDIRDTRWELTQTGGVGIEYVTSTGNNIRASAVNIQINGDGSTLPGGKWSGTTPTSHVWNGYYQDLVDAALRPCIVTGNQVAMMMPNYMRIGGQDFGNARIDFGRNAGGAISTIQHDGTHFKITAGNNLYLTGDGSGSPVVAVSGSGVGFNGTLPIVKPTVTGSRGGNAALASLLTALASYGLITDSSSA